MPTTKKKTPKKIVTDVIKTNGHLTKENAEEQLQVSRVVTEPLENFEEVALSSGTDNEDAPSDRIKNLKQAIESVFDPSNIRLKTILNDAQIAQLARAHIYADRYDSQVMRKLMVYLMELKVSGGNMKNQQGTGRLNMVDAIKSVIVTAETEERKSQSMRKRLMGF